jgi:Bacterial Ig domain/RTX calcium-binding nonapeptide repeat (4 copies)
MGQGAQLYSLLFSGTELSQIEVAGYANVGGTQERVDDYLFRTDFVTGISTGTSGAQQLSVAFGQVQLQHDSLLPTGAVQQQTQAGWDQVTNSAVITADPGPTAGNGAVTEGHGKTVDLTALINGLVTPGISGDIETLVNVSAVSGSAVLNNGTVSYTAPTSGPDTLAYTVRDQYDDQATGTANITVDPGPGVNDTTTPGEKVAHGTSVAVGTVVPGLPGDTLSLTEVTGPAGAVTLGGGIVSFAAPANARGPVTFSYQISDQLGDVSFVTDTLLVDPGPSITDTTTPGEKVAHGTSVAVGTVVPGLPGDTLSLTEVTGPAGAVTLGGGIVSFAAPANARGPVTFSYQISDQLGDVSTVSDTLAVDPGPTAGNAHLYLSPGQSTNLTNLLLALDTPGLPGDTLTLSAVGTPGTRGTVSLSNGHLTYTAPASGTDAFEYTVSDQLHDTATAGVNVSLLSTNGSVALSGSGNIVITASGNRSVTGGTGGNYVSLGDGNDSMSLSGNNNTVVLGGGNDSVSLPGNNDTATLGNGNDSVTAGANSTITLGNGNDTAHAGASDTITLGNGNDTVYAGASDTITLGNGNDTVYAGAGDTITLGNGNDTVYAGPGDTITLGSGKDLVLFGVSPSPSIMDSEIVNGFNPKNDIIEFNRALFASFTAVNAKQVGLDTIITHDPNDTVTLHGVALSLLTPSNVKIV